MTDVFAPATLGPVRLRNRTVKAATFEGRAPDGQVTDALIDYHLGPARGGVGLTTVAYLAVAPEGRTHREQIVVGEHSLAGLTRLLGLVRLTALLLVDPLVQGHRGLPLSLCWCCRAGVSGGGVRPRRPG